MTWNTDSAKELAAALASESSFERWLGTRGFTPVKDAPALPAKKSLAAAHHFHSSTYPRAPFLLALYHPSWKASAIFGKDLRARQRDANEYRTLLRAEGHEVDAPALAVLACPEFLVVFELNGDPFSRRLRFTPAALEQRGASLEQCFARLRASTLQEWAKEIVTTDVLGDILGTDSRTLSWDFGRLFVGEQLDDRFVAFLAEERSRIAALLLDAKRRKSLLQPLWDKLKQGFNGSRFGHVTLPSLERIALDRKMRSGLVATVDTVLLRFVLYRYLEAQFGYRMDASETREVTFGGFDDLLHKTVKVDRKKLAARQKKKGKQTDAAEQLLLFAHVDQPEVFVREIKQRADWYQQQAGGDLHHGAVAEAADVLQEYLLAEERDAFAELLAGTSTDDYSFHYADLDPRAFQRFYEGTIGTDLRVVYDPKRRKASVDVVAFHRNRKEQGAYYTAEELCRWLAERTLGHLYSEWEKKFLEFIQTAGRNPKGRSTAIRSHLDELMQWRILDPTCGGGIFLRDLAPL